MKFKYIGVLFMLPALGAGIYEYTSLNRAIDSLDTMDIKGVISDSRSYNGYATFKVDKEIFRMQPFGPCVDQRSEIQNGREVSIQFKVISRWPGTLQSYSCIIEIEYISGKKDEKKWPNVTSHITNASIRPPFRWPFLW